MCIEGKTGRAARVSDKDGREQQPGSAPHERCSTTPNEMVFVFLFLFCHRPLPRAIMTLMIYREADLSSIRNVSISLPVLIFFSCLT